MCGIAAFIGAFASPEDQERRLRAMTDCLAHRGPDGSEIWQSDHAGLGHRRLAIIDLNTGDQPMWDAAHEQVIVFNGEIYNYPELKSELIARGFSFRTSSDTEVIPAALQAWGLEDGLRRLRGMFAFALYDTRTRRMLVARDRAGIKPLYWTERGGTAYFASEAKSLLSTGIADRRMDAVSIHDYLTLGHAVTPRTCWADIHFLPPGSWMEFSASGERRAGTYWQWTPRPEPQVREAQWLDELEATLADALRCHLLSDVPLGAFLSGGLDSSLAVALLAARDGVKDLNTFNVRFDVPGFDESPFARQVAAQYRTHHHEILVSSASADPSALIRCLEQFDEPFGDTASLPNYLLSQATRKHVKVVLSGDGGDELLGGYRTYARLRQLESLSRVQWAGKMLRPAAEAAAQVGVPGTYRLANALDHATGTPVERITKLFARFPEELTAAQYTDTFRARAFAEGTTHLRLQPFVPAEIQDDLDRMLTLELRLRLQAGYLRKVDITSSAFGLETRVPYLDNRMLELSERIPASYKLRGDQLKYLGYRLAERYLPPEIVHRPKHGFQFPFEQWSQSEPVREFLTGLLLPGEARWRQLLRPEILKESWDLFTAGRSSPRVSRRAAYGRVYSLAALEVWLQAWQPTL